MNALRAALWLLAMTMIACTSAPQKSGGGRIALVIGNAAYENAPPLNNPVNDATDMCAALTNLRFHTLCHLNVKTRAEFEMLVKEFTEQLKPNSESVVYYAGHGVQVSGANYLIPTQANLKSVRDNPVPLMYGVNELFDRLREKPVKFQLVILDACRNDLFARTRQPTGRGASAAPESNLTRSLETVARASYGLAPIQDAPAGSIVFYATASKEAAYDGEGRNGPLTRHILDHIRTRNLKIEDFFKLVTSGVRNETRGYRKPQTPYTYSSFSGEFCFAGCANAIIVPPAG